ncbi:PREDICTED: gametocyte-specific factor 1-like [Nicrophorus vespilloides]|uniref:Gametocyte-specific factor 1-like n=1 Tax=Nicrophorus vespilloides TaxID=110193 RepID=A0ABM1MBS6_NICVS|nr:PREDICTED: gametocyte-specific factor 1-like [Nicrophorus vespilloides]
MPYKAPMKLVTCPFNKCHIFSQDRLQPHIIKCERKYPNHFICPFYNLHRFMDEKDYKEHVLQCDKKKLIEPWLYTKVTRNPVQLDIPDNFHHTGNWED